MDKLFDTVESDVDELFVCGVSAVTQQVIYARTTKKSRVKYIAKKRFTYLLSMGTTYMLAR